MQEDWAHDGVVDADAAGARVRGARGGGRIGGEAVCLRDDC